MDKEKNIDNSLNHAVQISERKSILISGVKKLENFDPNEFFIETIMGFLVVKGEELELIKYDTFQGTLSIKGVIGSLEYLEEAIKKHKSESIVSRLFK